LVGAADEHADFLDLPLWFLAAGVVCRDGRTQAVAAQQSSGYFCLSPARDQRRARDSHAVQFPIL
jgi:hypothetical protein